MNQQPPLPPPSGAICPNCGSVQNVGAPYCTHCGAPMQTAPKRGLHPALKVLLTIVLLLGALGFGGLGACMGFIGFLGTQDPAYSAGGNEVFWFAGGSILVGLVCLWLINWINNK